MSFLSTLTWKDAQKKSRIIQQIRHYFFERNVVEVETPLLSSHTITDVHLDAFSTKYNYIADSNNHKSRSLFLQTSPEYAMKKLLASGYGDIFQICKAFRHEEFGKHHNPEFSMLEWYRIGFNHHDLMDEVDSLLSSVLQCETANRVTYQEIFLQEVNIDPLNTTVSGLIQLIAIHGKLDDWLEKEQDKDILLQFVFSEIIESTIGKHTPCFVYNFPASQASLAKISDEDCRVAERFECYFKGLELANGFNELTCGNQQKERFIQDNRSRLAKGKKEVAIDENFIEALNSGLPSCAGVALGIDRLIMIALEKESIDQIISFPINNA